MIDADAKTKPTSPEVKKPKHNLCYYLKCMVGGILSCGLTHTAICPLDVVKCNMQVHPSKYRSLGQSLSYIYRQQGMRGLLKGWEATAIGYSAQGMFKFGYYEIFKDWYSMLAGEDLAVKYRRCIWLAASASAEFIADVALCPMEMIKVKTQTSLDGSWPRPLVASTRRMLAEAAQTRFPFGSIIPLWSRQIPYTMAKFYFFEEITEFYYRYVFTRPRETYSKAVQLGVTFLSGYEAGIICAIVSHPADSLVSLLGKPENQGRSLSQIVGEVGIKNLFTSGLGTRILMVGTLTGLQWWVYDSFKTTMGLGTSGGGAATIKRK